MTIELAYLRRSDGGGGSSSHDAGCVDRQCLFCVSSSDVVCTFRARRGGGLVRLWQLSVRGVT